MKELSSAFMKKHLILYNKLVRKQTYKNVSKMKANQVREIFNRDFRKITSGKDGKEFYAPRKYEVEIEDEIDGHSLFKLLSHPKKKEGVPSKIKKKPETKKETKPEPKKETKPEPKKDSVTLKKLVSTARSHKKNGISQAGLKDFYNKVMEFKKTNPSKLESQTAGVLYNYLMNNILLGKKRMPKNLNNALKELNFKPL